ncbi:hypothetical protein CEXT_533461 [Caerostris extrusa]|uniref:Uncharacterized protein n=1 Tax=Caerostris extrusa TaxID=172846 RepID=A0AAV4XV78_CAEEX|nr:hypothetical protein CEXT_533461 [Caerostris extrusa]
MHSLCERKGTEQAGLISKRRPLYQQDFLRTSSYLGRSVCHVRTSFVWWCLLPLKTRTRAIVLVHAGRVDLSARLISLNLISETLLGGQLQLISKNTPGLENRHTG